MKRKSRQFPKKKQKFALDWALKASDRSSQRRALARKWLREGQYSSYRYFVETCRDGTRVYLRRPTFLNKGFDFQVNVEGFRSKTRKAKGVTKEMPSHPDVFRDLRGKVRAHPKLKKELYAAVCAVYDCNEIDKILSRRRKLLKIEKGLPVDKTLRIIKWLFIEQDLTYWLGTGRNMLMSAIEKKVFKIQAELYE
ncbi:MAG: DNA adenine methylase [Candidatus Acidiferrales bacterium]